LDPQGEDLPNFRECDIEAQLMAEANIGSSGSNTNNSVTNNPNSHELEYSNDDMSLGDSLFQCVTQDPHPALENDDFTQAVRHGYMSDKLFTLVLDKPVDHANFSKHDGLIQTINP
jgi:hypothetical protein